MGFGDGKLGSGGDRKGVFKEDEDRLMVGSNHPCGDTPNLEVKWLRVGLGKSGVGICKVTRDRTRWESGEAIGARERVAPKHLRTSWPSRGTGRDQKRV